ncbi:MAG: HD domain-containing protein [Candidatus Melainabacteria bacterium]
MSPPPTDAGAFLYDQEALWRRAQTDTDLMACRQLAGDLQADLYLVGGTVRDFLLRGRWSADRDVVALPANGAETSTDSPLAQALARRFADQTGGSLVSLDPGHGIYRVVLPDRERYVDIADAMNGCIEADLRRRDLTVNALGLDLFTGSLLDPTGGLADCQRRTIRMVSRENLLDDPLRLLRVFRIAAAIRAEAIDPGTFQVVQAHKGVVLNSAPERIQLELLKLLDATPCFAALQACADSGLLEVLLPEMTPMRAIPANGHHHLGLFEHTLELVRQCERLLTEIPEETRAWVLREGPGGVRRLALIKLACLFHDLGKPDTQGEKKTADGDIRLTFYGHEQVSETLTHDICRRLKTGNDVRDFVGALTRWHLYPCQFGVNSPRKSLLRFFRRMGELTPDLLLLALADRHSTCGPDVSAELLKTAHENHLFLMRRFFEEQPVMRKPRVLNGHQVMQHLGILPGPELKKILSALEEAQQLGDVVTGEDALRWIEQFRSTGDHT